MSTHARVALLGVALTSAALGVFPLMPASGQTSASVVATGWWSRSPTASAPEGGMAIGMMPDGPATVAAIKVDVGDGVSSARLELIETGGTATGDAGVLACESSAAWEPVEGGALDGAPATECDESESVQLERDAESLTWSADLSSLVDGRFDVVSISLVPVQSAVGLGQVTYEVRWAGPPMFTATPVRRGSATSATIATTQPRPAASPPAPASRPAASPAPALNVPPVAVTAVATEMADATGDERASDTTVPLRGAPLAQTSPVGAGDPDSAPVAQVLFFLAVAAGAGTLAGSGRWFLTSRR